MTFDALMLSRLQFAFTVAFHIVYPSFTIGLASFLAVLEGLWLATRREAFQRLYLFWLKIFAISFGMGVVTGVVMSYQFGTNWSVFSRATAGVIGPLLGFEVLTAFFLESSFLGVMLFGWKRVGPGLHFAATCLVAFAHWSRRSGSFRPTAGCRSRPATRSCPTAGSSRRTGCRRSSLPRSRSGSPIWCWRPISRPR